MASGAAGNATVTDAASPTGKKLEAALTGLLQGMAKAVAWDGEGATCLMEVRTVGAATEEDAFVVSKSVAASSLTKAAMFGHDPNWGRIACAAGYSGARLPTGGAGPCASPAARTVRPAATIRMECNAMPMLPSCFHPLSALLVHANPCNGDVCIRACTCAGAKFEAGSLGVKLGPYTLMQHGQPLDFDRAAASAYLKEQTSQHATVQIEVSVGDGPHEGMAWGCDLSYDYVKINAEYTT